MHYILDSRTVNDHFPGIGRYVVNLARAMAPLLNRTEQLTLLSDPTQTTTWDLKALSNAQVQLVNVPLSPFSLRQQWLIPGLLRQLKADLYHSPYYLMPYRTDLPTLLTIYDLIPLRYPYYVSVQARLIFRWATALALQAATRVTTISDATRQDLLAMYRISPTKITTITLAADPHFRPVPVEDLAALRARLNLPGSYVLYLGSNKPHKNLLRLVKAWAMLQPQPFPLLIAGVWDDRYPDVKQQVELSGLAKTIRLLGPVLEQNLPALYSGAAAFVFPSEYEGFGLPVLEAMACGIPVACAKTSSLPEIAGEAALYFDPTDVAAMTDILRCLLTDPDLQADLRQRALRQAAQFSWEQTAQKTLDLYRQML